MWLQCEEVVCFGNGAVLLGYVLIGSVAAKMVGFGMIFVGIGVEMFVKER